MAEPMANTPESIELRVRYGEPAAVVEGEALRVSLPTDGARPLRAGAIDVLTPAAVRDALLALGDVLSSDLRRKASDRSDYLAYLAKSGKGATKALWDAQKKFLEAEYGAAASPEAPLDPIVTVSDDGLLLEAFSRDESTYASLFFERGRAIEFASEARSEPQASADRRPDSRSQDGESRRGQDVREAGLRPVPGELATGTTSLDLSLAALRAIAKVRRRRPTRLALEPAPEAAEARTLRVPYRAVRALGQMQLASTLPRTRFELRPIDLYNVLFSLRRRKAKKPPRGLRYELVPGERPRIVLEPWELVLEGTGERYEGRRALVVRTFGRNRLATLSRLLPHAERVEVSVLGPGLPAFYVVHLGGIRFTLGLSGWTDSGWAGVQDLDAEGEPPEAAIAKVVARLGEGPRTLEALAEGQKPDVVRRALGAALLQGRVVHDLATDTYRARALLGAPIDPAKLRFRDPTEAEAHRLLEVRGQVEVTKIHERGAEGTSIEGRVDDRTAKRSFRPSFTIDREGRASDASCTCPRFRRSGLREGPCEHMLALRLAHAREEKAREAARGTEEGRKLIRAETRTLIARKGAKAEHARLSLDDRTVTLRFGEHPDALRMSRLLFEDAAAAREEYFARLTKLEEKGFIDTGRPSGA